MMPRGACPSLAAPMQTGDGLLLRAPAGWWSRAVVLGIADAALRFGNGVVEITARGNLQLRGLRADSAASCAETLLGLGIADAPPIFVSPLAGNDATALADPRDLAQALAKAWPDGLAPKVSVVVDGGGALHLDAMAADIRSRAVGRDAWLLGVDGATAPR